MKSEPKISRFTFGLLVFVTFLFLSTAETIVVTVILSLPGVDREVQSFVAGLVDKNPVFAREISDRVMGQSIVAGFGVFTLVFARAIVDRVMRMMGLSLSGRIVERRRAMFPILERASAEDVIEIRFARSGSNVLTAIFLGFVLLIVIVTEVIIPKHRQTGREWLPALYALLLGAAAITYRLRYVNVIRIDTEGVTTRDTTIPWNRIASCDFIAERDTLGKIVLEYPVMKDLDGNHLFDPLGQSFGLAAPADQQRVLRSLKCRFPKLDGDSWESF